MSLLIVYWTGTGNTEMMAEKIYDGVLSTGTVCDLKFVTDVSREDINKYEKIAFGCPSMGIENLEEDDFEPFFEEIEDLLIGKKIALFGSYGWGDGEWMGEWENRVINLGANLFEQGFKIASTPDDDELEECFSFGVNFTKF